MEKSPISETPLASTYDFLDFLQTYFFSFSQKTSSAYYENVRS